MHDDWFSFFFHSYYVNLYNEMIIWILSLSIVIIIIILIIWKKSYCCINPMLWRLCFFKLKAIAAWELNKFSVNLKRFPLPPPPSEFRICIMMHIWKTVWVNNEKMNFYEKAFKFTHFYFIYLFFTFTSSSFS